MELFSNVSALGRGMKKHYLALPSTDSHFPGKTWSSNMVLINQVFLVQTILDSLYLYSPNMMRH